MKIYDAHIHVGQFREDYTTSDEVVDFLTSVGVERFAASSSSSCDGNTLRALPEMVRLVERAGDKVVPVLWFCPEWLEDGTIYEMLNSGIEWRCVKVHGYFHRWEERPDLLDKAIDLARKWEVPLLFHTGGREESDAGSYMEVIKKNEDVTFVLAHCRPVDQAIAVMKACPNCYGDTAFTPTEDVAEMIKEGLADRIMFGTDYPLHITFYPDNNHQEMYGKIIQDFQQVMSEEDWEKVSYRNFEKVFKIC